MARKNCMNPPACLPHICYSEPVPDSIPSPPLGASLPPPSLVKASPLVRTAAIYSLCTLTEHLVRAGTGSTASARRELQNPVEGR